MEVLFIIGALIAIVIFVVRREGKMAAQHQRALEDAKNQKAMAKAMVSRKRNTSKRLRDKSY